MKVEKNQIITVNATIKLLADAYFPDLTNKLPLVIFCHGYKGFKDWGAWELAMQAVAKEGFYVVKFNFSHNGTTLDNPLEFEDLEAFGRNTYSQEQIDLTAVINHFKNRIEVDQSQISIIGHSRGGGAVLVQALENNEVTKVVSWAGVADFKRRFPQGARFDKWKDEGVFYGLNTRTNQQMPHYFSFYQDFEANERKFDIQNCAQHLKKPLLIIQGTADEAVPLKEAEWLHLWAKNSELYIIEGADHVFGARHPWDKKELPLDLSKVIDQTVAFLKK
ncbi:S9 family peptidase [Flavobacterium sp. HSC-61S13]|uniref:alpha/beta hydrolase family protein n=1 Tax=Flavobacterium sp. HSC-61S13 TaxID=2910963 RepID=UPI00209D9B70|nr:alpha/beta fold hydrolase [Flavobacterium sp. HSC-61S13]MCP1997078.1 dipeptidyl aminopeptidase/acylaminoacyl peptidase [Flavobacterium sp. HSC-61S13]